MEVMGPAFEHHRGQLVGANHVVVLTATVSGANLLLQHVHDFNCYLCRIQVI